MSHGHKHEHHDSKADAQEKAKAELPIPQEKIKETGEEVRLSRDEFEDLQSRLKELEGLKEKFLRAAADFDNAKKRLVRERDEFVKFSQENLIRHLLPILDNLERALAHAPEEKDPQRKALVSGIQMVQKQFLEILKREGLLRLETVGKTFDPHLHEAVAYQEERGPADEILAEIEPGYTLHGKLLRAAKVRIRIASSSEKSHPSVTQEEKQEEIT